MRAGPVALAVWLFRYDIARRTVRQTGLPRFVALCLLSGYFWLCAGGLLAIAQGGLFPGPHSDAILHCVFLGFVLAMIFGHAPIIVPAVFRIAIPYRAAFYLHLVLLHASLSVRILGDLLPWWPGRLWGGAMNGAVVLVFVLNTLLAVRAGRERQVRP